MTAASRAQFQNRSVRHRIHARVLLAGLFLCTQVSCSGGASNSQGAEATGVTAGILPQTNWSLLFVDSQELTFVPTGAATKGFDGDTGTMWHTQFVNGTPPPPHEIQINLGSSATLNGFVYIPRQDGSQNGMIKNYEFYVSTDGVNWGSPVATGTWVGDATQKQVSFASATAQYVRLRALSEVNGNPWTSMAELQVLNTTGGNQAPDSVINSPTSNVSILPGGTVNFTGSGSDPDNNVPLTYRWNFGAGSGIADSTAQNPGVVQFNNPGIFTVTFTVTDSLGLADPTPATRVIYVTIPQTGWTLQFVDSQQPISGGDGAGVNSFDGNTGTMWHTQWINGSPPPPHEIQIKLGGSYNMTGFGYVPRQDGSQNGMIKNYEFYISTDGLNWGSAVATGTWVADTTEKQVSFASKTGQYVRLRALSEVNGNPWTSMAELHVFGTSTGGANQAPNGTITSPTSNVSITEGGTVNFTGSGSDPDNNLPLSYLWNFGLGSGISNSNLQNPGPVQFSNLGSFTVNFTVTDSLGLADPTPATDVITVSGDTLAYPSWTLKFVDSQEAVGGPDGLGVYSFDGNTGTMWHTQWVRAAPPPPHEIQIQLGSSATLTGFVYVPRQDGSQNGRIGQYEFYVSTDGVNWGSPVATGTFANSITGKQVSFATTTGQYVRLRALSEVNGNPWTSMAELYVLGSCIAPAVKLATPRSLALQTSTTLNVLANACLDSVTQSGWGVRFVLDGGPTQVDTHTPPFQAQFTNLSQAEHRIDAYIIDNTGALVNGTATHDQATPVGIGNDVVAVGDSITLGLFDDVSSDNTSQDGRNTGGGYEPVLNNLRTNAKHYPQTIANEGVGGATSSDGVAYIAAELAHHPDAQYVLMQYGTNDPGIPIPSGVGLNPGDAGYAGSFNDNMQRIITAVKTAGKLPYLAKVPFANGNFTSRDPLYQQYNQVIDQLVATNNIMVVPPDLYSWFQAHPSQLGSDGLHPTGIGYQSMATLWFNALQAGGK